MTSGFRTTPRLGSGLTRRTGRIRVQYTRSHLRSMPQVSDADPALIPRKPADFPVGFDWYTFTAPTSHRPITRTVVRREAPGPTVILIHEAEGLTPGAVAIADWLGAAGFTVSMPVLIGRPTARPHVLTAATNLVRICVAREFDALVASRRGPIVDWLMALARAESLLSGSRKVGVIGMCFSGGFALATVLDQRVGAAIVCQPALPLPFPANLGLSASDIAIVNANSKEGACIRAVRYTRDLMSPTARLNAIDETFKQAEVDRVPTGWPRHSALRDGVREPDGRAGDAARSTLAFLERHLNGRGELGVGKHSRRSASRLCRAEGL
jgi:dienelactone hydrolase